MTKQALRPEFFNNLPTLIKEKQAQSEVLGDEEKFLYSLSQTAGWRVLKEYTEGLLKDLDEVTNASMAQGLSLEEIGKNAIVANLAKGIIKRILEKVEDAKEAAEKPDGTIK